MRSYVIDELDLATVRYMGEYLKKRGYASSVENLFWLPVERELLRPVQQEHEAECGPYQMALELLDEGIRLELLVRAAGKIRCECVCYLASEAERTMMNRLDQILVERQQDASVTSFEGQC